MYSAIHPLPTEDRRFLAHGVLNKIASFFLLYHSKQYSTTIFSNYDFAKRKNISMIRFFVLHETAHEVQWTSVLRGPERQRRNSNFGARQCSKNKKVGIKDTNFFVFLKHETGFEPATLALARRYSTTEPLVHLLFVLYVLTTK